MKLDHHEHLTEHFNNLTNMKTRIMKKHETTLEFLKNIKFYTTQDFLYVVFL